MPYNLRITVFNNRDYEQTFTLQGEDEEPLSLVGCKMSFAIANDCKTLYSHLSDSDANKCIFITNAADGEFKLVLPYSVLKSIAPGSYLHDLILIDADNKRAGVWSGQMIVKKGVS